jgi:hypothetical protein
MTSTPHRLLPRELARIRDGYDEVYVIVSPPRCSSTAFARVFWEEPSIGFYAHEPFEVTYYLEQGLDEVVEKLDNPLDIRSLKRRAGTSGNSLVIKEMPYQVGDRFAQLAALATRPLVFLMRDPRLNIASRIEKKLEVGDDLDFPKIETGWELMASQIAWCRERGIPHLIVTSADFRNHPESVFSQVFTELGLPFSPEMLEWEPCGQVDLDNLEGRHSHLYARVLGSSGLQPADEPVPAMRDFEAVEGLRSHVVRCLEIFKTLKSAGERIRPEGATA